MATNPMFNNRVSPNGATAPNNPLNNSHKKYFQGYNTFDYSRSLFTTLRYADLTPFEVVRGVEGDKLPFGSKHFLRSYTLQSPMMSDIFMRRSYFMCDMRAILPINWDKIYKQPVIGDDISGFDYGTYMSGFFKYMYDCINVDGNIIGPMFGKANENNFIFYVNWFFHHILFLESVFSCGGLLPNMGAHVDASLRLGVSYANFDKYFDNWVSNYLNDTIFRFKIGETIYASQYTKNGSGSPTFVTVRQLLDMLRHHPDFVVTAPVGNGFSEAQDHFDFWRDVFSGANVSGSSSASAGLDLDVLYAYQICCAQFYTNTSVDYIYTAQLYRDNQLALWRKVNYALGSALTGVGLIGPHDLTFTYNGVDYDYDICSGHYLRYVFSRFLPRLGERTISVVNESDFELISHLYGFLSNIFSYQRSLRYGDYFTGSRTRPLSVGDVSVNVVDSKVSAIDVTRNLLRQRFFNAVGRVRNTMSDYLREVMHGTASPRDDEARYLSSIRSHVSGFEVENTSSEDQGKLVTNLKSGDSRFVFEIEVGSPCIVIGIASFDSPRIYSRTLDRFYFHESRFDRFNPFMQYAGDQEVYAGEKDIRFRINITPFSYTLRHMEYKQRFPIAAGGFVNSLPSWLMVTDNDDGRLGNDTSLDGTNHLTPEYIRSKNYELDRFYSSLTGYSLGTYFHFIVRFDNIVNAKRRMEYSPSIL